MTAIRHAAHAHAHALALALAFALVLALLSTSAAAEPAFETWQRQWEHSKEQTEMISSYDELALQVGAAGPVRVMQKLGVQLESLQLVGREANWRTTFLCRMNEILSPLAARSEKFVRALELTPAGQRLTEASREDVQQAANGWTDTLKGDYFHSEQDQHAPGDFMLFHGAGSPCGEVSIPANWTGQGARDIWRAADVITSLIAKARLEKVLAMAETVAASDDKWSRFFKNVVYDGFPWELYANEVLKHPIPALRGTLAQPPSAQLRVLHPTPVMVVSTQGPTTFKPNMSIEVLGWRRYDETEFTPRWGASALIALRESGDESTGYGMLLTFKRWSIGAIRRDTERKDHVIHVIVGVDVAEWYQKKRNVVSDKIKSIRDLKDKLEEEWKSAAAIVGH